MMLKVEQLKERLKSAKQNERHGRVAESRYWCEQYKMIAEAAVAALQEKAS